MIPFKVSFQLKRIRRLVLAPIQRYHHSSSLQIGSSINLSASQITASDFDFYGYQTRQNPYPYLEALRQQGGIHFLPLNNQWLFLNHKDVVAVLKQPQVFSSSPMASYEKFLLGADSAAHKRVRSVLMPYFSASSVAKLTEIIEADTRRLLDELANRKHFDVAKDFLVPLVDNNLARFLELEAGEFEALKTYLAEVDASATIFEGEELRIIRLGQFFKKCLTERSQRVPLKSGRLLWNIEENELSADEVASLMGLFWEAGTKTTQGTLTYAMNLLLQDPELKAKLKDGATLIPPFLEEVFRFAPPIWALSREVTSEVEISGVRIPAGASVCLSLEAANRDPSVFPQPNVFLLERNSKEHVSFGSGVHFCIGVQLARLVARTILQVTLTHAPTLRLLHPEAPHLVTLRSLRRQLSRG